MTSTIPRYLLLAMLFLVVSAVHAEGGCPPGFEPSGVAPSPQDPVACRPIPSYNQQQTQQQAPPPPSWISQWGAVATDAIKGSLGTATNLPSKNSAEQVALADCQSNGGLQCKINVSYDNECAVLVVGATGYNVSANVTLDKAIQHAMKVCGADGDKTCQVYYSACSLPVQIQ